MKTPQCQLRRALPFEAACSGISPSLCFRQPPCWGTCRRLMLRPSARSAFPATAWESAAFRTCQASIAGSWPLTAIPAGTSCGYPSVACPPVPRRCSCSMERVATADCSCACPAGGKRRHRKTSSPFSQPRLNTSFWRRSVSRPAGTTTAFRPRSIPIGGRPAIRRLLPGPPMT